MRRTSIPALALTLALVPVAAARAATIHTDAGHVIYDAAAADQVDMGVNTGSDPDVGNAVFFIPFTDPAHTAPTTADPNCRASASGSKCASRTELDINAGDKDDFVRLFSGPSTVVFNGGGGKDRIFSDTQGVGFAFHGQGGDDWLQGNGRPAIDTLDGGPGNDLLDPGANDDVHGGADFDTVRMSALGVTVTLDDAANDGPAGEIENIHSDVEQVAGGAGVDQIDGNAGPNTLDGGDGNDTLNGLGGADTLIGGAGNDTIRSRDGVADSVSCGPGDDRAIVDPVDTVSPDCETVEYADDDHDGFDARTDCNDGNAAVHPGAGDIPGNGIDEDCSGADAPAVVGGGGGGTTTGPADADHDGVSPPVDCNDASAAIHPGARDVPGDGVDQDCSGADARLPLMPARVRDRWTVTGTRAHVDQLTVRGVPKGGRVVVDCKGGGCPFARRAIKVRAGRADAGRAFGHRLLRPGAVVQVTVTAPGYVGKVMRYRFAGHRKVPSGQSLCLRPGALTATRCG